MALSKARIVMEMIHIRRKTQNTNIIFKELIMTKWADYCISAVRYDEDETHIVKVKVHADS